MGDGGLIQTQVTVALSGLSSSVLKILSSYAENLRMQGLPKIAFPASPGWVP